ncbi:MAG: MATE family efflux transporter [Candidatus Bathyarchaeota archaeon]|nr:MATE family efflux transporter [Candidatus Bathyarchaeota archaeon]
MANTFWIDQISYNALAITEQYEFLGGTIEIVNEMIPFGILALVAQNFTNKEKIAAILKSGIILQIIFSSILMSIVVLFTPQFVSTIGTPTEIVSLTSNYLLLKAIALLFDSVAILLLIAITSMRRGRDVIYLVLFSGVLNVVLDLFLISNTSVSLNMGVQGAAIGYVISKVGLLLVTAVFTGRILGINLRAISFSKWNSTARSVFAIGGWTGLDSLVRNVGYILVLLNVLNVIGTNPYGGYGLAMTVMWTLIIPVLAVTEGTNVVVGNYYGERNYTNLKKSCSPRSSYYPSPWQ